jgi:hypothetical protein
MKMKTSIFVKEIRESFPYRNWKSIRNKSLQKLLFLHDQIVNGELRKPLEERSQKAKEVHARKHPDSIVAQYDVWLRHPAEFLKPEDVMPLLHCGYRTAQDYVYTIKALFSF